MKKAFYFTLKALSVLKIFNFLFWQFGNAEKRPDKKAKENFKIHDVTNWKSNNHNTHIDYYLKKKIKIEHITGSTVWNFIVSFLGCTSQGLQKHTDT